MPRTAARPKAARNRPDLTRAEPQASRSDDQPPVPPASDRGTNGRFIAGNRGGPGNPNARHCAGMLDLFRTAISEEDVVKLCRVLFKKALQGDVSAAKLVLAYKIGKPAACPDPDGIERDEWDHYQQDAIEPDEIKLLMSSLPSRVGNDIARTALPIMTEARTRELATQLRGEQPDLPQDYAETVDACEKDEKPAPIPIGNSDSADQSHQALASSQKSTTRDQLEATYADSSRRRGAPNSTSVAPISNGNSKRKRKERKLRASRERQSQKARGVVESTSVPSEASKPIVLCHSQVERLSL